MADAIVTFLVEKLTRLLDKEAKLLIDVKDKVTWLRNELNFMDAFLNSPQGKQKEDKVVKQVVNQIRNIAHEAEDIIDTYISNMVKQGRTSMIKNFFIHGVDHMLMLRNLSVKIDKVRTTIDGILANKDKYKIEGESGSGSGDRGETEQIRKQRKEVEEEKVAGFESYSRAVIEKLMIKVRDDCINVVSIVGMGGLGKTTLARKVYNNDKTKDTFPCRAWGYVSNDFQPMEFFLSLLQSMLSPADYNDLLKKGEGTEELKMKVQELLKGKKYLVVVDDFWQIQLWNEIKETFPDECNGSRILITTRSTKVASHVSPMLPYTLPFLNKQKSWELLFKKVFRGQKKCPSQLEPLGRSIAESCDGLPLAIIAMAEILANNQSQREWSRVKDHVNWYLGKDKTLKNILKLSYDNLPERLKPCFLYFGMYPQDYNIPVKQLIQLWISEGLLTKETSVTTKIPEPEFIAEDYLAELVNQSLVQVVYRTCDGGVKTCRIHNVLRNLCISESKEDGFFEVFEKINSQTKNNFPRRLSLHGSLFNFSASSVSDYSVSATRSLLCFNQEVSSLSAVNSDQWKWLLKSFKLARVLDLGGMNVNSFPPDLKNLIHLRYLRVNSQNLETIPDSICKLWNLETLDLRGSPIKSFSGELWRLKQLRHLLMLGSVKLPDMPSSQSETMLNLQTLSAVSLDPHTTTLFDNGAFPGLTSLALHYEKHDNDTCNPSTQLQSLHHLRHLRKLKVIGTTDIPQNAADVFPKTITKITITKFGFFESSAMNTLGKLPNLQVLKLSSQKSNASFDLHCATGGFPQLQVFVMVGIKVKNWRLNKGSMPCVGRVVLRNCKLLNELPKELWSLITLSEVNVSWPTKEFAETLQNLEVKNKRKLVVYPHNQVKNEIISK